MNLVVKQSFKSLLTSIAHYRCYQAIHVESAHELVKCAPICTCVYDRKYTRACVMLHLSSTVLHTCIHNYSKIATFMLKWSTFSNTSTRYYLYFGWWVLLTRITKNYEFKKGVGIDSTIKSTETRILLSQFSLQKFNPYFWLII